MSMEETRNWYYYCNWESPITNSDIQRSGTFTSMASTSSSQVNYTHNWPLGPSDDSTGFVNSSSGTTASQPFACGQGSFDYYTYSPYSPGSNYSNAYYPPSTYGSNNLTSNTYQLAALKPSSANTSGYSLSQQWKTKGSAASGYLSNYDHSFVATNSQTAQNSYCYGLGNSSATNNSTMNQTLSNCQQNSLDYSLYYSQTGCSASFHTPPVYDTDSHLNYNISPSVTPKPNALALLPERNSSSKKGTTKTGAGRGKSKRPKSQTPVDNSIHRVFVWEMDDVIIIYKSLVDGTFAAKFRKDTDILHELGQKMQTMTLHFAETNFFLNDLEGSDQIHIDEVSSNDNGQDLSNYNFQNDGFRDMGRNSQTGLSTTGSRHAVDGVRKLAFRYRRIKEIYNQHRNSNVSDYLGNMRDEWFLTREKINGFTDCWSNYAFDCLEVVSNRHDYVNVLVTSAGLVQSLSVILLHGLGPFFPVENVYNSKPKDKDTCFRRIKERFGNRSYVVVGDGSFKDRAEREYEMPYWTIDSTRTLQQLHHVIKEYL